MKSIKKTNISDAKLTCSNGMWSSFSAKMKKVGWSKLDLSSKNLITP